MSDLSKEIKGEIMENGITDLTYAKVFALKNMTDSSGIAYIKSKNSWVKNGKPISELRLIGLICDAGDSIRQTVEEEWENSIFSVIMPSKMINKIQEQLATRETIASAANILKLASDIMSFGGEKFDWGEAGREE